MDYFKDLDTLISAVQFLGFREAERKTDGNKWLFQKGSVTIDKTLSSGTVYRYQADYISKDQELDNYGKFKTTFTVEYYEPEVMVHPMLQDIFKRKGLENG